MRASPAASARRAPWTCAAPARPTAAPRRVLARRAVAIGGVRGVPLARPHRWRARANWRRSTRRGRRAAARPRDRRGRRGVRRRGAATRRRVRRRRRAAARRRHARRRRRARQRGASARGVPSTCLHRPPPCARRAVGEDALRPRSAAVAPSAPRARGARAPQGRRAAARAHGGGSGGENGEVVERRRRARGRRRGARRVRRGALCATPCGARRRRARGQVGGARRAKRDLAASAVRAGNRKHARAAWSSELAELFGGRRRQLLFDRDAASAALAAHDAATGRGSAATRCRGHRLLEVARNLLLRGARFAADRTLDERHAREREAPVRAVRARVPLPPRFADLQALLDLVARRTPRRPSRIAAGERPAWRRTWRGRRRAAAATSRRRRLPTEARPAHGSQLPTSRRRQGRRLAGVGSARRGARWR